jgi:dienelactone hydrolase
MLVAGNLKLEQIPDKMNSLTLRSICLGIAIAIIVNFAWGKDAGNPLPTDHQRLDYFLDASGKEQEVKTTADWEKRRAQILLGFQKATGPLPDRKELPALDIQIKAEEQREKHVRQTIDFVSEKGDRTPCYLYIPKGIKAGERRPAIVALHPTHKIGKDVVDGLSQRPNRGYANELADRGYVVIAPDYLSFGEYADYDFATDRYISGTMKGIWNHMRCVDLLQARPDVDGERIGAIGHSLGGHNAIFLGVMDPRVKVVVSSCGWTPFHDYYGGKIKGWTSERYMPGLESVYGLDADRVPFDFYELVAALAPRAFFSNSPLHDSNFDYRGIEKAAPKIRQIYNRYGVPDHMRIAYPDSEHDFPNEVRHASFRFLDQFLKPGSSTAE